MGFMSYFQTSTKAAAAQVIPVNEKFASSIRETLAPIGSELNSISPSPSTRAQQEDRLIDEIKHQVVLNHIFEAQCSSLLIRDVSTNTEGVMIRKRRNDYLFKPPGLAESKFARAMMMLNVQVSFIYLFPLFQGFSAVTASLQNNFLSHP